MTIPFARGGHAVMTRARVWLVAAAVALLPLAAPADTDAPIALDAKPVPLSDNVPIGARTGRIRFLGMLALPRATMHGLRFSQLSDLAWDEDDGILYALSDKGALFHLRPVFGDGVLVDIKLLRAVPLRELDSGEPLKRRRADSEGMDIVRGHNGRPNDAELIVSFERFPRIMRYRPDGRALVEYPLPPPLADRKAYQEENLMLEAVCVDPLLGILTMPEARLKSEQRGFNRIYSLSGRSWLYPVEDDNRVVSMACLGNGEVLVLERDYGRLLWRALVALKRVRLSEANAGKALAAERVVKLDSRDGFQIDNFEGITRHRGNRFFIVSDDNDLFIQRTLLMYFELLDP